MEVNYHHLARNIKDGFETIADLQIRDNKKEETFALTIKKKKEQEISIRLLQ